MPHPVLGQRVQVDGLLILDDGCGNAWSSGTVLPAQDLVVFGTADCKFSNTEPLSEAVLAMHLRKSST